MDRFDFSGWATRNDLLCGDGRTIRKDAFKENDGATVPLVWNHQHNDPDNVLGHALLENRDEGVYAYCSFNDTEAGKSTKELVKHGDIRSLSIYANKLQQVGGDVVHGRIRELSLVLAGANPGAFIEEVIAHGDGGDGEYDLEIGYDENIMLYHSDDSIDEKKKKETDATEPEANKTESTPEPKKEETKVDNTNNTNKTNPNNDERTVEDVFNTLTDEQKTVVYAIIGQALKDAGVDSGSEGGTDQMKHNIFDNEDYTEENVLSHSDMELIIQDGKKYGSLKESFLSHADEYGITNIDYLFPDAKNFTDKPEFISRKMDWVQKVMSGTHHTPFSRIKSIFADITEDEARAKGYLKGNLKKEEVFSLLKRVTTPTTIYKKQKLDRDDVIDITDFDVVAWLKSEMRTMLDEEIARSILIGDGRLASSNDKINEINIRPIWTDDDLYAIKALVSLSSTATDDDKAKAFIKTTIKSRKDYKGSGTPNLYTTEDVVTDCLLIEDTIGRRIYDSVNDLATALRVNEIITVEPMESQTRTVGSDTHTLMGIIANLADYNVGADQGGAVNMFDDFDIDYNQQKYLIETRCSGALTKPYSAIVVESVVA